CNTVVDRDCDGVPDDLDNCPDVFNPDQANSDGQQLHDAFDDASSLTSYQPFAAISGPGFTTWIVDSSGRLAPPQVNFIINQQYPLTRKGYDDAGSLKMHIPYSQNNIKAGPSGFAFRVVDSSHYYRFVNDTSGTPARRIEKVDGATVTTLASL